MGDPFYGPGINCRALKLPFKAYLVQISCPADFQGFLHRAFLFRIKSRSVKKCRENETPRIPPSGVRGSLLIPRMWFIHRPFGTQYRRYIGRFLWMRQRKGGGQATKNPLIFLVQESPREGPPFGLQTEKGKQARLCQIRRFSVDLIAHCQMGREQLIKNNKKSRRWSTRIVINTLIWPFAASFVDVPFVLIGTEIW